MSKGLATFTFASAVSSGVWTSYDSARWTWKNHTRGNLNDEIIKKIAFNNAIGGFLKGFLFGTCWVVTFPVYGISYIVTELSAKQRD